MRLLMRLLGAALVLLVVAELVMRLAGVCVPDAPTPLRLPGDVDVAPFSRPDPLLLYALVPGTTTFPWYGIDRHGWRTPAFEETKRPGTLRVVVTGDSSTFGLGLAEHEHWPARLRSALAGFCEGEREVEVINAAITGYSTHQNRLQIERDILPLQPDLVVLMMSGANDTKLLDGLGDLALFTQQRAWWRALFRTHVACLLGLEQRGWVTWPAETPLGAATGRPRLTLDEVESELDGIAALLPGRLLLGLFPPHADYPLSSACDEQAERVAGLAEERGWPLADLRPTLDALEPLPVYADMVHPTPAMCVLIAREVLRALLPHAELSEERTRWAGHWFEAQEGGLPQALAGGLTQELVAPPRFLELVELLQSPGIDGHIARGEPELPEVVRRWDPLYGSRCLARSRATCLLEEAAGEDRSASLAEIDAFVRPADPLLSCFPSETTCLADEAARDVARALIVHAAELGLPPWRADLRAGRALQSADPREAEALLRAVLALDPGDAEARFDLAFLLRSLGRFDDELEQFRRLALAEGPLAHHARGVLAVHDGDPLAAEEAFRRAIEGAPSLGWAHLRLASVLMRDETGGVEPRERAEQLARLDEAARELTYAAMLMGTTGSLPDQLAEVEVRREMLRRKGP
jgi:lysophospholipase L1-like esterase/Flp pilus assembly protein TadD